jgi:glycerophosphodiester phosphodiesterase
VAFLTDALPTFQTILRDVPVSLGFNVEIKYPMLEESVEDDLSPTDLNEYVDKILQCIFDHAGERRIFFSTFHPDLAYMVERPIVVGFSSF